MKRVISMCAAVAVVLAAAVSCCNKAPKVTALVAGPEAEPVALVLEYGTPVSAASLTPDCFVVPGREVACVAICEGKPCEGKPCEAKPCDNPAGEPCAKPADENCHKCKAEEPGCCKEKPCCKEGKCCCKDAEGKCEKCCCKDAEGKCEKCCCKDAEGKCEKCCEEGKPCCSEGKPCCKKPEGKPCKEGKPSCPKAESGNTVIVFLKGACPEKHCEAKPCDKPAEEQCDKCKAGEPCEAKPCAKPAEEQCDKCKDGEKCAKEECKKECDKKDGKCELTVPEISIRQVAPLTTADGKEIKPWKKDAKATAVAPAPRPHHHGKCHKN